MIISFIIPGKPVPWPRAIPSIKWYGVPPNRIPHPCMIQPNNDDYAELKRKIQTLARENLHGDILLTPVRLGLDFVFPRIKTLKRPGRAPMRDAPDLDNCCKAILDSLVKVAIRDDRQVVGLIAEKFYAAEDEQPHTRVEIYTTDADFEFAKGDTKNVSPDSATHTEFSGHRSSGDEAGC